MENLSKEYQKKLDFSSVKKDENNLENSSSFPIFSNLMQITPLTRLNQSNENSNINIERGLLKENKNNNNNINENRNLNKNTSKKELKNYYEKQELFIHTSTKKNHIPKRGNFILRQELKNYTPECNAKCGIISNFVFMICCLSIGIPLIIYSKNHNEFILDYTNCINNKEIYNKNTNECRIKFKLEKRFKSKIFIYYKLKNFYLNHRKLVKSKSWNELRGEEINSKKNCKNALTMKEMFGLNSSYYTNQWNYTFNHSDIASPCGLFARSFFNDTYNLTFENGTFIFIDENNISNKYLKNNFFKRRKNYQSKQWIDVENEHFINWMNVETFNTFRKLWGKINIDLLPGNYILIVKYNYHIHLYEGKKFFVISESNIVGQNSFFGYFLIAVSGYCFLVILILWVLALSNKEKMFDINVLKWN